LSQEDLLALLLQNSKVVTEVPKHPKYCLLPNLCLAAYKCVICTGNVI